MVCRRKGCALETLRVVVDMRTQARVEVPTHRTVCNLDVGKINIDFLCVLHPTFVSGMLRSSDINRRAVLKEHHMWGSFRTLSHPVGVSTKNLCVRHTSCSTSPKLNG